MKKAERWVSLNTWKAEWWGASCACKVLGVGPFLEWSGDGWARDETKIVKSKSFEVTLYYPATK